MAFLTPLKAFKGATEQATLVKGNDLQPQIIKFGTVDGNRDIDFKINNSTWQYVEAPGNKILEVHGGIIQESIALYPGEKTLSIRTVGFYIGVIGINGTWWMSKSEFLQYN